MSAHPTNLAKPFVPSSCFTAGPYRAAFHRERSENEFATIDEAREDGLAQWPEHFERMGGVVDATDAVIWYSDPDGDRGIADDEFGDPPALSEEEKAFAELHELTDGEVAALKELAQLSESDLASLEALTDSELADELTGDES